MLRVLLLLVAALPRLIQGVLRPAVLASPCLHASRTLAPPRCCSATEDALGGAALPPPDDIADEVLKSIVLSETTDAETNELVWKYLGYKRATDGSWDASDVFPNWAARYPEPPDLLGVTRTYTRQVDEPVLRAVQSLQRSVPREHKSNLKATLRPLGWKGFLMEGLTPNMTRRAQVATWLLYYRNALHGVSIDELKRRKAERAAAEEREAAERGGAIVPGVSPATGTTKQSVI